MVRGVCFCGGVGWMCLYLVGFMLYALHKARYASYS